jgi:hypothetical protein
MVGDSESESGREGCGMGADSGAPGFAGGSFNGPLMPHPVNAQIATTTIKGATERRNIRSVMRLRVKRELPSSLARRREEKG